MSADSLNATAAWFASANPTLDAGVVGTESDTQLSKTGDGVTPWQLLPYGDGHEPVVTGSRAGNAALTSLLTVLAQHGIIIDSSTV